MVDELKDTSRRIVPDEVKRFEPNYWKIFEHKNFQGINAIDPGICE
jgi:hypothetical protein